MTAAVMPVRAVTFMGLLAAALAFTGLPLTANPGGRTGDQPPCSACHQQVDSDKFAASVHGFLSCTDCHTGATEFPHAPGVKNVNCAACHEEEVTQYQASIHGQARSHGATEAPNCMNCHGNIHTLKPVSDPDSPLNPLHVAETCSHCHSNPELVAKFGIPIARPLEAYKDSVHARAVLTNHGGATCSNCHGSHGIFPGSDPRSTVFHQRVPDTCGQCHAEIAATYKKSIHGQAASHGVRDAPVCTDCHGEHRILAPEEPGSPVSPTNLPLMTCGRCHSNVQLAERYGLPLDKVPSYEESYHGLAARAGIQTVANCASCHGVHDILPSSDPRSTINPANLPKTCGQCHPGAGSRFGIGPVHVVPTEARFAVVYYIRLFYLPLIYLVIGGGVLHNLLDFIRKARTPAVRQLAALPAKEERMSKGFRVAHGLVIVSFSLLVWTGFALKFPDAWWARPVVHWESGWGLRGLLHRTAAVILLGSVVVHLLHLSRSRRARACIAGMRPTLEDFHEFKERVLYYLGRRPLPPTGAKLSYIEKSEYIAFLWGTVIMAGTGFLLWFNNFTLRWFPKWMTDAATAIHSYEAILATLAILVWHFYWVIFDPSVYPMDMSWWSGRPPLSREVERQPAATSPPADAPAEEKPAADFSEPPDDTPGPEDDTV